MLYEVITIYHDKFVWESEFVKSGMVRDVIKRLMDTGKVVEDEVFRLDLSEYGIEKKLVLARLNGTSLYSTRDIAYHINKMENCDFAVNLLGADHKLTAVMVNKTLALLGYNEAEVVFYEFISLRITSYNVCYTKLLRIGDILSGSADNSDVTVIGMVTNAYPVNEFSRSNGGTGKVRNIQLDDSTGSIRMALWDSDAEIEISEGDVVKLIHGFAKESGEYMDLSTGRFGRIEVNPEGISIKSPRNYIAELEEGISTEISGTIVDYRKQDVILVITSYSIHYTKLYDGRNASRTIKPIPIIIVI